MFIITYFLWLEHGKFTVASGGRFTEFSTSKNQCKLVFNPVRFFQISTFPMQLQWRAQGITYLYRWSLSYKMNHYNISILESRDLGPNSSFMDSYFQSFQKKKSKSFEKCGDTRNERNKKIIKCLALIRVSINVSNHQ